MDENNPKGNKFNLRYKSTYRDISSSVENKVKENIKSIAEGKTKEIDAKYFIISCLKNYSTGKTLPPKRVPMSPL